MGFDLNGDQTSFRLIPIQGEYMAVSGLEKNRRSSGVKLDMGPMRPMKPMCPMGPVEAHGADGPMEPMGPMGPSRRAAAGRRATAPGGRTANQFDLQRKCCQFGPQNRFH